MLTTIYKWNWRILIWTLWTSSPWCCPNQLSTTAFLRLLVAGTKGYWILGHHKTNQRSRWTVTFAAIGWSRAYRSWFNMAQQQERPSKTDRAVKKYYKDSVVSRHDFPGGNKTGKTERASAFFGKPSILKSRTLLDQFPFEDWHGMHSTVSMVDILAGCNTYVYRIAAVPILLPLSRAVAIIMYLQNLI